MHNREKKVAIVKNADAKAAVALALDLLGGIDDLVKDFSHIVIKPNLCGGVAGEPGSHTSLGVLQAVLEVFSSYALPIIIGEADCSFNHAGNMFASLRIHELAEKFGVTALNLSEGLYTDIAIQQPNSIKNLRISSIFKDGLIVSVPVLKTHPWSGITISMKNMYGATYQREKAVYHNGLEKNIVDINKAIRAHLCIVDATIAVVQGGFKYGLWVGYPPSQLDIIIAGYNPVCVDAVGTHILSRDPWDIGHIELAARQGLGICSINELTILSDGYTLSQ
jgi:uncharacterized protein (DUF362 family)